MATKLSKAARRRTAEILKATTPAALSKRATDLRPVDEAFVDMLVALNHPSGEGNRERAMRSCIKLLALIEQGKAPSFYDLSFPEFERRIGCKLEELM